MKYNGIRYKLKYLLPNIKHGLKNFWIWRKIIWNDRPWDHSYFLKMLEKKLYLQYLEHLDDDQELESYGNYVPSYITKRLLRASELCNRIEEDTYFEEIANIKDQSLKNIVDYFNNRTKEEQEQEWAIHEKAAKNRKADIKELTTIMNEDLLNWWT